MIFVTVGTHEQQFNRLVEYMDGWAEKHQEEVIIQTGFCTYEPHYCKAQKLFAYKEMKELVDAARIVITHGGPSSFIAPLQMGKTPIVVPRKKEFNEHVNNHQVDFCRQVSKRMGTIILIEDIEELGITIDNYDQITQGMKKQGGSNNAAFCEKIESIVDEMMK